jgi:hypothetical protein
VEITRRRRDAEFNEAQIVFANANARMELAPPGDDEANKSAGDPMPSTLKFWCDGLPHGVILLTARQPESWTLDVKVVLH